MKNIRRITFLILLALSLSSTAFAEDYSAEYHKNMRHDLARGFKNVLTGWVEIPVTMHEHLGDPNRPVFLRPISGLVDGAMQTLTRTGSGFWDLGCAFIPGHQEGVDPGDPETFF